MSAAERTDNTSLVPQYSFPETLAEQEAALQTNPLLQRLLAYRKRYEAIPTGLSITMSTRKTR